ncbi:MAG: gephyrin-like molybdotransferase Glp [Pseudomonadota bacterium]
MSARKLLDDCFLHDKQRMRHEDVLVLLGDRLAQTVGEETVPLTQALQRVCAEDVTSPIAVPQSDNAAVDGFAFSHRDYIANDGQMPFDGTTSAGTKALPLSPGTARQIFTGAVMPEGADTLVMMEDCEMDGEFVQVPNGMKLGANRRSKGEDVPEGSTVLRSGHVISAAHIAALASIGLAKVNVRQKLRVGILSTGDEIVQPGASVQSHQVYDANRPMLASLLAMPAIEIVDIGHLPDDPLALSETIKSASQRLNLIISTGGASRGGEDHMLDVLDTLGKRHIWQIAIKPGRPMMFGQVGDCVLLGLPGNPVAAFVCCLLYVRPTMARLMGVEHRAPRPIMLPAGFSVPKKKVDRREFARAWRDEEGRAQKFARDGSGLISGLVAASGLIDLPEEISSVAMDELVRFIPFSEFEIAHKDQP